MKVAVSGASGFIGRHLISELAQVDDYTITALHHREAAHEATPRLAWVRGSLEDEQLLRELMPTSGVFVHLAYPAEWSMERHVAAATRLGRAAVAVGLRRFVHCSTAIVAGNPDTDRISEDTPCRPVTGYEQSKLEIERALESTLSGSVELVTLRPTAVFGPGGKNLVKLAKALTTESKALNYLRSSLFGRRSMNLVCLGNVIAALRFLIERPPASGKAVYLVSDDDDPLNNFRDVEAALMRLLSVPGYVVPPIPVPQAALAVALRAAGRASAKPHRIYDTSRLAHAGYVKRVTLSEELKRFANWFRQA